MLESGSTADTILWLCWRFAQQTGAWLDRLETGSTASPIKQLLETHSTAGSIVHCCYPVLESGSTAVAGVRLNGGYKSAALQFNSFERREDTPDRNSNLTWSTLYGKYKCGHVVSQAMWCLLGKSSYLEQGKRLCSLGDAVIHHFSVWLDYSILPQVRILPVKLPQAVCPQAVN